MHGERKTNGVDTAPDLGAEKTGLYERIGRGVALYGVLGITLLAGAKRCFEMAVLERDRVTFGTLDEPRFEVRSGSPEVVRPVRESLLAARAVEPMSDPLATSAACALIHSTCTQVEATLGAQPLPAETFARLRSASEGTVEDRIRARLALEKEASGYSAECARLRDLSEVLLRVVNTRHDAIGRLNLERFYGELAKNSTRVPVTESPPIDYAKAVFKVVTGQDLPSDIAISIESFDVPGLAGTATNLERRVQVAPLTYPETVSTLCHEFGHLIARPGLDLRLAMAPRGTAEAHREAVLEEACAYAFERCCIAAIPDDAVRLAAAASFESQAIACISRYLSGETDLHYEALTVVEATVEVLGDSSAAYRYLSTTTELSPEIARGVESLRAVWGETAAGQLFAEKVAYGEAAERVRGILERFDPTFRR